MFSELEEKCIKFEEQQKREEREFQLKVVQMLPGGMVQSSMYPPQYHKPHTALPSLFYMSPGRLPHGTKLMMMNFEE